MSSRRQTPPVPPNKIPLDYFLWFWEIKSIDFAKQVGVSSQDMSRYRRGLRPTEDKRKLIARKLKVSLADLGWETETANV